MQQSHLLLLTNLVIGKREKIRLYELIKELERRGIFFDKESRKALVEFYERLGNVEKMSDSGDAIYVKKTI
ncbi:DNA phosphorothioation-dependent restriction protein DptG [Acinetobacter sp. 105-3]|uniref:DNA phosphorothioation-dependent restriction protein DptG n=1 Tax=Acinetobacter sp. 105-3 TaxID=2686015 RepID=UPI002A4E2B35|nr:DNA phosphorothioation-dependent restriction protein DptG [Acinetobacter sp. 105-3]